MNKMRRFATKEDLGATVKDLWTKPEMIQRDKDYQDLTPIAFKKKYQKVWDRPVEFEIKGKSYTIQINTCTNPFCGNYGLTQEKFNSIKSKPSRYKIISATSVKTSNIQAIECTRFTQDPTCTPLGNSTTLLSNWSVAEEIIRLITINSVVPDEFELIYHKEGCLNSGETPHTNVKLFYKRGKSKVGTQRYQCKSCEKTTNEQPTQKQSFSYGQKRNDEIFNIFNDLMNRTPVSGTMRKNEIGASTYYNKLEWIYRKCLEFLDRHETLALEKKEFKEIYLNTDAMVYHLNYKRLKSEGKKGTKAENKLPPTYIYATADVISGYVFRTDVAYDYSVTLEEIELDSKTFHCDHSSSSSRKNERLRHEFKPQPPTIHDPQTMEEFNAELTEFQDKENYVDGLHVKHSYTCIAHLWLLREQLKAKQFYFVTDGDFVIQSNLNRIFHQEIKEKQAHHITCEIDKTLTQQEAGSAHFRKQAELRKWAKAWGYSDLTISEQVRLALEELLAYHDFYEEKEINGVFHKYVGKHAIQFPYPFMDEGHRYLTCMTDVTHLEIEELARILSKVNGRAIDKFFQKIHRSISVLERPLTTSRGDGKSYIYSNYNPRYAQYLATILRVYYNFCLTNNHYNEVKTPAQRLGITDKVFTVKDIIYFK